MNNSTDMKDGAIVLHESQSKSYGPLFGIHGFIFLDNNQSANIGIDVEITNMETMESLTTQTMESGDLTRYEVEIQNGLPSGVNDGDQIRVSVVDDSYSGGSYRGEAFGIADTDTFSMTVNVTLSYDSNPWVIGFSLTSQEIFEGESIDFQVQALDDNGVEKVTLEITGETSIPMSLSEGNSTDGIWICSKQFDNKGTYSVKAVSEDTSNQTSIPTQEITITVKEDNPPKIVLSANATIIPLSGSVGFTANITEDRYLNDNVTFYINGAASGSFNMTLDEVTENYQIWLLDVKFNLTGIYYCQVTAWDDYFESISNTLAISVGVNDSAPVVGSLTSNISAIVQNNAVIFTINGSDDFGIDNIYLFSTDSSYNVSMSLTEGSATDGSWSTVIVFITAGYWRFKAHAIDTTGNDSGNSTSVSITVIKADNEPEIMDIVSNLDSFPAVIATGTDVSFQVSTTDDNGVTSSYLLVEDVPLMMDLISGNSTEGIWKVNRIFDLPGLYSCRISLTDTSEQVVNSSEFLIDVNAPPTVLKLHTSHPVAPVNTPITFNVTAYDDTLVDKVEIVINGTLTRNMTRNGDSWGIVLGFTLPGMYQCVARAFDNLSQYSESNTWVKIIPDNAPTLTVLRSSEIFIKENEIVHFTIEASDDYNVSSVILSINFQPHEMVLLTGNTYSNEWVFSYQFADEGEYTCTAIARDSLGQESDISNAIIIIVSPSTGSETSLTSTTTTNNASPGFSVTMGLVTLFLAIVLRKKRKKLDDL